MSRGLEPLAGSGAWELDALKGETLRKSVEVGVAVEHGEPTVFGGGCAISASISISSSMYSAPVRAE